MTIEVRPLREEDVPELHAMIKELAEYEKLGHLVSATPADLAKDAFGARPKLSARVAEDAGRLVGYAIYSPVYFSFTGEWLYLDDLYVRPEARSKGAGRALLAAVADDAALRGCHGIQWFVLDWNEPAIRFYDRIGATIDRTWLLERVRGGSDALRAFAARLRAT